MVWGDELNLASKYGTPFSIHTPKEGDKYLSLSQRNFMVPKCLDMGTLNDVKLKDMVIEFFGRLGWKKFVEMTPSVFRDLKLEFYTTLKLSN